jgi:hypothetical protein
VNGAVIAAAGISFIALFLFLTEGDKLSEAHAGPRAHILNALRWGVVVLFSWALIPLAFVPIEQQRASTIIEICALVAALMLVPVSWFVRIAGRDARWELRRVKVETTRMANRIRNGATIPPARIREERVLIEKLRTIETNEMCDLLLAELDDLQTGFESWNEAGRRAIRIDELSRQYWPDAVPPPDYDPQEATFRWRLYRTFGQMMEVGVMDVSPEARDEFQGLMRSLDQFRRPDTEDFIDDVMASADRWLSRPKARSPWIGSYDFSDLGPEGLDEVKRIWGRDAALWGAELGDEDRLALAQDIARRGPSPESEAQRKLAPVRMGPSEQVPRSKRRAASPPPAVRS